MTEELQTSQPAPAQTAEPKQNLNRWLGRHDAFDMVGRHCSAADVICLKQIREEKLYLDVSPNWDQFCKEELRSSRTKIDGVIGNFDELGPAFFELAALTRVTANEFRQLAPAVIAGGISVDGEVVAIAPENRAKLEAAVSGVRKPRPAAKTFRKVLDSLEAATALLENPPVQPDDREADALGAILQRIQIAAACVNVFLRP